VKRFWLGSESRWVKLRITVSAMRDIDKRGIEVVVRELRAAGNRGLNVILSIAIFAHGSPRATWRSSRSKIPICRSSRPASTCGSTRASSSTSCRTCRSSTRARRRRSRATPRRSRIAARVSRSCCTPASFALGNTIERCAHPERPRGARRGPLQLRPPRRRGHATAGFIDPGFEGQITLELSNLGRCAVLLYRARASARSCCTR
jgi:hypothetical protein